MQGIYKIINPIERIYIGSSKNIEKRWERYQNLDYLKRQVKLYRSFLKYGIDNHTFEIIEECEFEKLYERERYWGDYFNVLHSDNLNCLLPKINDSKISICEETRLKLSLASKGRIVSEETRRLISIKNKNKKRSTEAIENMKKAKKGTKPPLSASINAANVNQGKPRSEEVKRKISISNRGKIRTDEQKINIGISKRKSIVDTITNIKYNSLKEATIALNIKYTTLSAMMTGQNINSTNLVYYSE